MDPNENGNIPSGLGDSIPSILDNTAPLNQDAYPVILDENDDILLDLSNDYATDLEANVTDMDTNVANMEANVADMDIASDVDSGGADVPAEVSKKKSPSAAHQRGIEMMIVHVLENAGEANGLPYTTIQKLMIQQFPISETKMAGQLRLAVRRAVDNEIIAENPQDDGVMFYRLVNIENAKPKKAKSKKPGKSGGKKKGKKTKEAVTKKAKPGATKTTTKTRTNKPKPNKN